MHQEDPIKEDNKKKTPEERLFHKPITKKKAIIYSLLALALAAAIILCRFIYVTVIDARTAFPDPTPVPTRTPQESAEPTQTLSPEELLSMQADKDFMKDRINIVLAGIDYSSEREGRKDFRTDTIMLFSVNFSTHKVDILSLPRDSYADIAFTDNRWKINGAWMSAGGFEGRGFECLMQTITSTLGGIPVDYYAAVEMQAVKDVVDAIGGVWYDVDYEINMDNRHLNTGYQLLDGQAVLDYCRARKDITSGTDIDRIDRQQRLLLEVFKQLKSEKLLPKIPEIYTDLKSEIYTNLNFEQIAALTFYALDIDPEADLNRYALTGKYMKAYNATYYVLDHTYTQEVVKEIFGIDADIDWTYDIEYVEYDMAARDLEDAINQARDYLNKNKKVLSPELASQAQNKIGDATSTLQGAQGRLKKARNSNSISKIKSTSSLEGATKAMIALYEDLHDYVLHPPAPTPSPTPSPTKPAASPSPSPKPAASPTPTASEAPPAESQPPAETPVPDESTVTPPSSETSSAPSDNTTDTESGGTVE
jgi:LCP family protein required for cell wall assembly